MLGTAPVFVNLSNRKGFNASVRHINSALDLIDDVNPKLNIADAINQLLIDKEVTIEQIPAFMQVLLLERWKYSVSTKNISKVLTNPEEFVKEIAKWKAVDIVLAYHHPDLGYVVINPKNPDSIQLIEGFRANELLVVYAGTNKDNDDSKKLEKRAIDNLLKLVEGRSAKTPDNFLKGPFTYVKPKPATTSKPKTTVKKQSKAKSAASKPEQKQDSQQVVASVAAPGQIRLTPLISVVVSNELFHNGNVEAWKRIIRSYNAKYPSAKVFIYYEGERIVDINTLFKWGKVKHGSCIQFRVQGENIQDLAKLQRYFKQGASNRFEDFLRGSPDTIMALF